MTALSSLYGNELVDYVTGQFKNKIINGNFDIWQRDTTFNNPSTGSYFADRWCCSYNGTIGTYAISRQAFTVGQTDVPNEPTYYIKLNCSVAFSGQSWNSFIQKMEDVRTLAGKTVTVSFYAKASVAESLGTIAFRQYFGSGGSSQVDTSLSSGVTLSTSWTKFVFTATLPSISGKTIGTNPYLQFFINLPTNETFNIDIAQVQIEEGSSATDFEMRHISQELALCKRYYEAGQMKNSPVTVYTSGTGYMSVAPCPFKVEKRATPTIALSNTVFLGFSDNSPTFYSHYQNEFGFYPTYTSSNADDEVGRVTYDWTADAEL